MVAKRKTAKVKSGPGRELLSLTIKRFIDDYIYRIDLDADYQREKIWSREQQLKLMDSIIKNIDIPKMYLAKVAGDENFDFECIDGKQRMSTLLSFLKPEPEERPLTVSIAGENYTYKRLQKELESLASKIDKLSFAPRDSIFAATNAHAAPANAAAGLQTSPAAATPFRRHPSADA